MIKRQATSKVLQLAQQFRAVLIMGPRQSGKTTLTKQITGNSYVIYGGDESQNRSEGIVIQGWKEISKL